MVEQSPSATAVVSAAPKYNHFELDGAEFKGLYEAFRRAANEIDLDDRPGTRRIERAVHRQIAQAWRENAEANVRVRKNLFFASWLVSGGIAGTAFTVVEKYPIGSRVAAAFTAALAVLGIYGHARAEGQAHRLIRKQYKGHLWWKKLNPEAPGNSDVYVGARDDLADLAKDKQRMRRILRLGPEQAALAAAGMA